MIRAACPRNWTPARRIARPWSLPEPPAGRRPRSTPWRDLATERKLKTWELAGLSRLAGWAPGKHATPAEFEAALARFRSRRMGGGR